MVGSLRPNRHGCVPLFQLFTRNAHPPVQAVAVSGQGSIWVANCPWKWTIVVLASYRRSCGGSRKKAIESDGAAMYDAKSCPQTSMSVRAVHSMDAYFTRLRVNTIPDAWSIRRDVQAASPKNVLFIVIV